MVYPAVLLRRAAGDSRVDPMHARKRAARLPAVSDPPVLFLEETRTGHGAGKPLFKVIEEATDTWSSSFWQVGVEVSP